MSKSYKRYPLVRQEKKDTKSGNRKCRYDKYAEMRGKADFKKYGDKSGWSYRYTWAEAARDYFRLPNLYNHFTFDEWHQYYQSICIRK